jgi:probable sodium:solute symporter
MPGERSRAFDVGSSIRSVCAAVASVFVLAVFVLAMLERFGISKIVISYGFVALAAGIVAVMAILSRTARADEFFVAGRRVPAVYNGMATGADWISATSFIGMAGALFLLGHDGLAFVLGWTGGFVLMAVLVAPYLRKSGAYTVPDFFGERFEGNLPRLLAVVVLLCCSFVYLVAQTYAAGLIASRFLGIDFAVAIYASVGVMILCSAIGGMRSVTWVQVALYIVLFLAYLTPIIILSARKYNLPIPELTYGRAFAAIGQLEKSLLAKGIANSATLKPHTLPFQTFDPFNYMALILCLMAGTAALPHVLMRSSTVRSVREARSSIAWSLLFIVLVYMAAPAYAAFAKLEIYAMLDARTPIGKLPDWIRSGTDTGLVSVYGVSTHGLKLAIGSAKAALTAGASDAGGVLVALQKAYVAEPWYTTWTGLSIWPEHMGSWHAMAPAVQDFVFNEVKANPAVTADQLWQPALKLAADAAGASDGILRHGGLVLNNPTGLGIDPGAVVLATPAMAGMPFALAGLLAVGALAAAVSVGSGLLLAMANSLSHDIHDRLLDTRAPALRRLIVARVLIVVVALLAAAAAASRPADILTMVAWAFSIAAAGIFPALVLGIWWKRANWAGCVAGIIAGFAVCLYYMCASRYFAVSFYEFWSFLSDASPAAIKRYSELKQAWITTVSGPGKDLAYLALDAQAVTMANWLGVRTLAAAIFALPVGFVTIVLVSLATPAPSAAVRDKVDAMRRPIGHVVVGNEAVQVDRPPTPVTAAVRARG